ncbi:MAG: DNA topoisomerase III [Verrucomicrobia bacterium Tous-C9LFEB]|nr:MAG: DNA topoisomerase III [Verrucomicrobia bacterium Tous-C9LFEB]
MPKALIIAEKPSVASDIAKVLGGFTKGDDFYESDQYVLSSAIGHLVELCLPSELDKQKGKWKFENLPVIPQEFALKPIEKTEARLKLLKKLMKRDDVTSLINACDAGREGELIFRYIVKLCGIKKPIKRLWLQSMTPASIRDGFAHLRPGTELESLAEAAVCRSESDWLVGINGTRALTAFNSKNGGFQLTPVGRVQTPTLAIVVERDLAIKNFKSKDYWEVHATFGAKAGTYEGRWVDETFKKASKEDKEKEELSDLKAERIWTKEKAEAIAAKCAGKPGIVTEDKKPTSQLSPLLYDLTSLQREGNGRFGLSAKRTLQIAQALYERHKVITYPRTDSRCLPEDYIDTVKNVLRTLGDTKLAPFAKKVASNGWVRPNKRIFNNAKISDHFAIIPTLESPEKLDDMELKVYELIAKRFLAVFYPAAQFEVTTRITRVENEPFKTEGKILREPGWMEIYGREEQNQGDENTLVAVEPEEKVSTDAIEARGLQTRPPARFNEATLLSAMEGAGKLVEDEELREAMAEKGLGTPATRAAIIEGLILEEYMRRDGRELSAAPKAFALFELLKAVNIPGLSSPEMTGEWEYKLKQIEHGNITRDAFMHEIVDLTRKIVEHAKTFEESGANAKPLDFKSPTGSDMVETLRNYESVDKQFQIRKVIGGRLIEKEELKQLIQKRFIGPLNGFRSKMGFAYSAALKLADDTGKVDFVFDNSPVDANGDKLDLTTQEVIATCPVCGGRVFETLGAYACENSFIETPTCKFKVGKKILSQEIPREQVHKIVANKKSDLLTGFVSQRTRRKFSAYLVLGEEGKTTFEFPEREAKPGAPANGKARGGFRRFGKPDLTAAGVAKTMPKTEANGTTDTNGAAKPKAKAKAAPKKKSSAKKKAE